MSESRFVFLKKNELRFLANCVWMRTDDLTEQPDGTQELGGSYYITLEELKTLYEKLTKKFSQEVN